MNIPPFNTFRNENHSITYHQALNEYNSLLKNHYNLTNTQFNIIQSNAYGIVNDNQPDYGDIFHSLYTLVHEYTESQSAEISQLKDTIKFHETREW